MHCFKRAQFASTSAPSGEPVAGQRLLTWQRFTQCDQVRHLVLVRRRSHSCPDSVTLLQELFRDFRADIATPVAGPQMNSGHASETYTHPFNNNVESAHPPLTTAMKAMATLVLLCMLNKGAADKATPCYL